MTKIRQTALITGASSGIGLELARLFAKDGSSLFLVARREEKLKVLRDELLLEWPNIKIDILAIDLSKENGPRLIYEYAQKNKIAVSILVNNAGVGCSGKFADTDLHAQLNMIQLNNASLVELTYLFLQPMKQMKAGKILIVGSTAGFQPGPFMLCYYASKAFVNSFSEGLAEELKNQGISVTLLAPGATATEFSQVAGIESTALFRSPFVMSAIDVAQRGYQDFKKNKVLCIPGYLNKFLIMSLRLMPRSWVRLVTSNLNQQRL